MENTKENKEFYDKNFYDKQSSGSYVSAKKVLPILIDYFSPNSIGDVGCGVGTWLKAAKELGINLVHGFDGEYVVKEDLWIDAKEFTAIDIQKKIYSDRTYDMLLSLEVGEHIYSEDVDMYIDNLCSLSNIIVFSGAIPGQGGVNHVNENWPTFWQDKFLKKKFIMFDMIRPRILHDTDVETFYRQNIFVFIKEDLFLSNYTIFEHLRYTDEFYIIHKTIIDTPFHYMIKCYEPKIILFTKKWGIYKIISFIIRLFNRN